MIAGPAVPDPAFVAAPVVPAGAARRMMGGWVSVHVADATDTRVRGRVATRTLDRLAAWSAQLSRHRADSELSVLNACRDRDVPAGPTLAAALDWARQAESETEGLIDVAMLDARLAAEAGTWIQPGAAAGRRWSMTRSARGAVVHRDPGVRLDLDGVAKGWLADRALALTPGRSVLVDADGDIAARVAPDDVFHVAVADPRAGGADLAVLALAGGMAGTRTLGLATSGTSVHHWHHAHGEAHHLIDPATRLPAITDVAQATVLAGSARAAETWAKVAVIAGADRALDLLDRPAVLGAVLLLADGQVRASEGMLRWLA